MKVYTPMKGKREWEHRRAQKLGNTERIVTGDEAWDNNREAEN